MDLLVQIRNEVDFAAIWTAWCQDVKKFNIRKPCCGYTLHNGIVAIAILDVIGAVLAILPLVILLVSLTVFKDFMQSIREDLTLLPVDSAKTVEKSFILFLTVLTLVISISLLEFYLAMWLLNVRRKKKLTSCYKWWRIVVVVFIALLFVIGAWIVKPYSIPLLIFGTIICSYKIYCYHIVSLFIKEIGTRPHKDSDPDLEMEMEVLPTVYSGICEVQNFTEI